MKKILLFLNLLFLSIPIFGVQSPYNRLQHDDVDVDTTTCLRKTYYRGDYYFKKDTSTVRLHDVENGVIILGTGTVNAKRLESDTVVCSTMTATYYYGDGRYLTGITTASVSGVSSFANLSDSTTFLPSSLLESTNTWTAGQTFTAAGADSFGVATITIDNIRAYAEGLHIKVSYGNPDIWFYLISPEDNSTLIPFGRFSINGIDPTNAKFSIGGSTLTAFTHYVHGSAGAYNYTADSMTAVYFLYCGDPYNNPPLDLYSFNALGKSLLTDLVYVRSLNGVWFSTDGYKTHAIFGDENNNDWHYTLLPGATMQIDAFDGSSDIHLQTPGSIKAGKFQGDVSDCSGLATNIAYSNLTDSGVFSPSQIETKIYNLEHSTGTVEGGTTYVIVTPDQLGYSTHTWTLCFKDTTTISNCESVFSPIFYDGIIKSWHIVSGSTGNVTISLQKTSTHDYYSDITDGNNIVMTSKNQNNDTSLSGWTTLFNSGDSFKFGVESSTDITNLTLAVNVWSGGYTSPIYYSTGAFSSSFVDSVSLSTDVPTQLVYVPYDCTIKSCYVLCDTTGSVNVSIERASTYDYFSDITGGHNVVVSLANKNLDNTLSDWTTSLTAGDVLKFSINSASGLKQAIISLKTWRIK